MSDFTNILILIFSIFIVGLITLLTLIIVLTKLNNKEQVIKMFIWEKCNREFGHEKLLDMHKKIFRHADSAGRGYSPTIPSAPAESDIKNDVDLDEVSELFKEETDNKPKEAKKMDVKKFFKPKEHEIQQKESDSSDNYSYQLIITTTSNALMNSMSRHFEEIADGFKARGHKAKLIVEEKKIEGYEH